MDNPQATHAEGPVLLLVAAKSLQSYVLGSDKLREMVGATQLIEDFCSTDRAGEYLKRLGITDGEVLTGAAGQITVKFEHETSARRAAALWPWFASRLAPGLEVHVGVAPLAEGYKQALDGCQAQIALSRNRPPASLPCAAPPHLRNPRSGLVAVGEGREPDGLVPVDAEGQAKRKRRDVYLEGGTSAGTIFSTFELDEATVPDSFEDITKGGPQEDRTYLAIVHADGNGFGKMLMGIGKAVKDWEIGKAAALFQALSEAIRKIGEEAAKQAIKKVDATTPSPEAEGGTISKSNKPWLPIVQAGDDLTLVIRADLAFDFLVAYLRAFEETSRRQLQELCEEYNNLPLPDKLTAGGAIVFCKTQHPFSQAYALCESIAGARAKGNRVKDAQKSARSALAFHRITASTSPTEITKLAEKELRCTDGHSPTLELGCQTWFVSDSNEPFNVMNLKALRDALADYPSGSRRQILSDLRTNRHEASARLVRMLKIGAEGGRGDDGQKIDPAPLKEALAVLHDDGTKLWRDPEMATEAAASAIPDALILLEATRTSTFN
jgi:hypothetical protein